MKPGAGAPLGGGPATPASDGHVVNVPSWFVPVERVGAERRHVEIEIAVVVDVSTATRRSYEIPAFGPGRDAGPLRDVVKGAVVIVVVQRVEEPGRAVED
jgi:hypothetical protein